MSDRAWAHIHIKTCPPKLRPAVNEILSQWEFYTDELMSNEDPRLDVMDNYPKGMGFNCEELRVGNLDEVTSALIALRDVPFHAWQEPYSEWLGDAHIYVPGQPEFAGECDSQGTIYVGWSTIQSRITHHGESCEQAVRHLFGVDILAAYHNQPPLPPLVTVAEAAADLPRIAAELHTLGETI